MRRPDDPCGFAEPFAFLAPCRQRQVVDFAQVLDHRREQRVPRRSGQRRPFAQQLDLAFPRQVEYRPREFVQVQSQQLALGPAVADSLGVPRQSRASHPRDDCISMPPRLVCMSLPAPERDIDVRRRSRIEAARHYVRGKESGLTDEEIARITEGPGAAGWDDFDATLLRAARDVPEQLRGAVAAAIRRAAGLDPHADAQRVTPYPDTA